MSGTDLFLSLPKCRTPTFAICQKLNSKNPPKKQITVSVRDAITLPSTPSIEPEASAVAARAGVFLLTLCGCTAGSSCLVW